MLKKLVNWCKKIIPIIGASLLGIGLIIIIALAIIPHGRTYTYNTDVMGQSYKAEIIFEDDDELIIEQTIGSKITAIEYKCRINEGKLFTYDKSTSEWIYEGKINAYEFIWSNGENLELVMECKASYAFRTLSIILMVVGGFVALAAMTISLLYKKGIIKFKETVVVDTPLVESTQEPQDETNPIAEETSSENPTEGTKSE